MIRTNLGRSRVRESRTLGSVGATLNGLATPIRGRPVNFHRRLKPERIATDTSNLNPQRLKAKSVHEIRAVRP